MLICILTKNVITSCSVTMMLFLHLEVKPLMTLTTVLYLSCALISGHLGRFRRRRHEGRNRKSLWRLASGQDRSASGAAGGSEPASQRQPGAEGRCHPNQSPRRTSRRTFRRSGLFRRDGHVDGAV